MAISIKILIKVNGKPPFKRQLNSRTLENVFYPCFDCYSFENNRLLLSSILEKNPNGITCILTVSPSEAELYAGIEINHF